MNQTTQTGTAWRVGLAVIGAILAVLLVFLVVTWLQGDPTNDIDQRQPSPSPANS